MDLTTTRISEPTAGLLEIPARGAASVRVIADELLLQELARGRALDQLGELATIPKVSGSLVGFPNLHEGESVPSGCVVVTASADAPVIPAAVGPEINCGVRLLASKLREETVRAHLDALMDELEHQVHVGDDKSGPLALTPRELDQVLEEGCRFLVESLRLGNAHELAALPDAGEFLGASARDLPARAKQGAAKQLGTLGSGCSHFVEIDVVDRLYDPNAARTLRLFPGQVVFQIHASARDLGKRVYDAALALAQEAMTRLGLSAPRAQLAWAPLSSKEGERCCAMLQAAANFGLANRHVLAQLVRKAVHQTLRNGWDSTLHTVWDASSNTLRVERWDTGIHPEPHCVHRRGTAPAYEPGNREIPPLYRDLGQPLLIPGSMAAPSYVMVSNGPVRELAWASAPHGAGRSMSRHHARQQFDGMDERRQLEEKGILLRCPTEWRVAEEAPGAYRDAGACAVQLQRAGIALPVAQLRPMAILKG